MLARVEKNENVFGAYYHMVLTARGIGRKAGPGMFYMLKVGTGTDPLLRRPLSLHRVVSPDSVMFLYKDVGRGTGLLARMAPGDEVDALGPLGNGFKLGKDIRQALLVAGGIGVAPLLGFAESIIKTRHDVGVVAFIGGRGEDDLLAIREFRELGVRTYLCTEDGSMARCGVVTDTLKEYVSKYARHGTRGWTVYTCGPKAMMRSVAAICKEEGLRNYASLESGMACGIGACLGCVVSILDMEKGVPVYKKVCDDGPVFDTETVIW